MNGKVEIGEIVLSAGWYSGEDPVILKTVICEVLSTAVIVLEIKIAKFSASVIVTRGDFEELVAYEVT